MLQHVFLTFRTGLLLLVSCTAGWTAVLHQTAQAQERGHGIPDVGSQHITLHPRPHMRALGAAEGPFPIHPLTTRPLCTNGAARAERPPALGSFWTCTDNPVIEYVALGTGLAATGAGTYFLIYFFNTLSSAKDDGVAGIAVLPLFLPGAVLTSLGLPVTIRGIRCVIKMENTSASLPSPPSHASAPSFTLTVRF